MTQRQREVLSFMRGFTDKHGAPPTVREIAERFRFTPRAAFDHLRALERKGMLQRRVTDKRVSRTLVLTDRGPERARREREIPILGKIAAGVPIFAIENREDVIPVRPEWVAAMIDQEATVKRFGTEGGAIVLKPEHPTISPSWWIRSARNSASWAKSSG